MSFTVAVRSKLENGRLVHTLPLRYRAAGVVRPCVSFCAAAAAVVAFDLLPMPVSTRGVLGNHRWV